MTSGLRICSFVLLLPLFTGCGSPDPREPGAPDAGATLPPSSPTDAGTSAPSWPAEWTALEETVLVEVNQRRAQGATCGTTAFPAVPALTEHAALRSSARLHSQDMATHDYFNHTSQDGRTPFQRIRDAGYTHTTLGENISAGRETAAGTVDGWMRSEGHCRNIMSADFRHLGVGYAYHGSSTYGHYWTQNFGG